MKPTHKNIINKIVKLYLYSYPSFVSKQQDEDFCKNISLYFKSSNEFIQINLVQKHGWTIKYIIKNGITPSEKVQIEAVKQNGTAIQHIIKNGVIPSEKVQIAAVNQDGNSIHYIENPSEKVQLTAVSQYSWSIYHIKNPYSSVIELYEKLSGIKYEKQ
jgi:ribosomal protein S16